MGAGASPTPSQLSERCRPPHLAVGSGRGGQALTGPARRAIIGGLAAGDVFGERVCGVGGCAWRGCDCGGGGYPDGQCGGVERLHTVGAVAVGERRRAPGAVGGVTGKEQAFQRRHPDDVFHAGIIRFGAVEHRVDEALHRGPIFHLTTVPATNDLSHYWCGLLLQCSTVSVFDDLVEAVDDTGDVAE